MKKKVCLFSCCLLDELRDGHFVFWAVVSNNKINWDVYRSDPRSWWREGSRSKKWRIYVSPHTHTPSLTDSCTQTPTTLMQLSNTEMLIDCTASLCWLHFVVVCFFLWFFFLFFALFSPYLHFLSLGLCVPATHYVLKQVQWWWRLSFSRLHFLFVFCEFVYRLACLSVCLLLKG